MTASAPVQDSSDPVSYTCTCSAQRSDGQILLFYRYWDNAPKLPPEHSPRIQDPHALAAFHQNLATRLALGGKFRLAKEGFNITLGGTTASIVEYIEHCRTHWSFGGIDLSTPEARDAYFKPTPGCACAFSNATSVKVTAEITPLGITGYLPSTWSNVVSLPPAEFHDLCKQGDIPLIDVRNHYESRIGYFTTSTGDIAVRPAVRRFSQWPGYVSRHVLGSDIFKKPIATYCTGGIRCEKGARWMQEALAAAEGTRDAPVYTLQGGIVAYQAWMQREMDAGRMGAEDGFFKGRNYVFDARGAIGAGDEDETREKVATCHECGQPEDRLGKCQSTGCHLVLVVCELCEQKRNVTCCEDCRNVNMSQDTEAKKKGKRMCRCETEREKSLWGDGGAKLGRTKGQQRNKTAAQ